MLSGFAVINLPLINVPLHTVTCNIKECCADLTKTVKYMKDILK